MVRGIQAISQLQCIPREETSDLKETFAPEVLSATISSALADVSGLLSVYGAMAQVASSCTRLFLSLRWP